MCFNYPNLGSKSGKNFADVLYLSLTSAGQIYNIHKSSYSSKQQHSQDTQFSEENTILEPKNI